MEMEDVNPGYEEPLASVLPPHNEIQPTSSDLGTEDQTQESYQPEHQTEDQTEDQTGHQTEHQSESIYEDNNREAPQDYQTESEPTEDAR